MMRSALIIFLASALCGCTTHIRLNNAERFMNRPDFEAARMAAPEWCRDVLKEINALELELEKQ